MSEEKAIDGKPTFNIVKGWARAIVAHRGKPPYKPRADQPDYQVAEIEDLQERACVEAEAALLSDFVTNWLPKLNDPDEGSGNG